MVAFSSSTVCQIGVPEIDLQTIDNLGRTLIDVARYIFWFGKWHTICQIVRITFTETATPFSCLCFKRKSLQRRAKLSPKKGSLKKRKNIIADFSCCLFFQIERWSWYRRPSQLHWRPQCKSQKWKEKESEEKCEMKIWKETKQIKHPWVINLNIQSTSVSPKWKRTTS